MSLRSSYAGSTDAKLDEIAIRLATEADASTWDAYLDRVPMSSPLSRYAWLNVLNYGYDVRTLGFIAEGASGAIVGLLPAYVVSDFRHQRWLYSLKFGLVADSDEVARQLMVSLREYCAEHRIIRGLTHAGYSELHIPFTQIRKNTLTLELGDSEEAQWASLRSKTRNMIRKAGRNDLVAERGFHNLREFYEIYCNEMLRMRLAVHPYRFFQGIAEHLADESELIVAKHRDQAIAGILVVFAKDVATYPFNVSLRQYHQYAPNPLLIWEAVEACLERRVSLLDMGESNEGSSVYQFKKNFGGTPRDVFYYVTETPLARNGVDLGSVRSLLVGVPLSRAARILSTTGPERVRRRISPWVKSKGRIL